MPPGGIYLHVPFCSAICPYCDFAVTTGSRARREDYARRLVRELRLATGEGPDPVRTVYFGGGTPSALAVESLASILETLREVHRLDDDAWISLEANPEDVTPGSLRAWRELGVRTLSLGIQSFDDEELRWLGRRHRADDARRALSLALEAGFHTVSVDLIFGLPQQAPRTLRESLASATGGGAQHVSCYQLTIHEGTPFARQRDAARLRELPDEDQAELYLLLTGTLCASGFLAYEVSNFARGEAHRSRHNEGYWSHAPYLGLGNAAHSFSGTERWWNERDIDAWARRVDAGERPIAEREILTSADLALERVFLRLRTAEGLDLEAYRRDFGVDLVALNAALLERLDAAACIARTDGWLALSPRGLAVADGIVRDLETGVS